MTETSHRLPTQWDNSSVVHVGWMKQFRYMTRVFEMIKDVPGDVVECGIGEGNTFAMLAYLSGSENPKEPRMLRGFDSFEGFPEPDASDKSWRDPKKGEWKVPIDLVNERLERSNILKTYPSLKTKITPGFLGDTLPKEGGYQIAFLHLDVDIYPSYRDGLKYLFPLVAKGGVVLFDEYMEFSSKNPTEEKWPGATKAIDEYLKPLGYEMQYYAETKKYYVIKK
jgi:hypothetical protein